MAGAGAIEQFKDAMVFLAVAGIGVPLLQRLKVNPVLGFMLAGMAIGPYGLGLLVGEQPWLSWATINKPADFEGLGEIGVIFLLFTIGLDLSFARLWTLRRLVFGLGSAQVAASALVLGGALTLAGLTFWPAIVAGLGLALSSTAVVMQLLISRHRFATSEGQTTFAVLLMQDLMVVPILFLVGALGAPVGETMTDQIMLTIGYGVAAVVLLLLTGRFVVPWVMRAAAKSESHEIFIAVVLLVALASAALTGAAGLPTSLGAFIAGAMLAESAFKHQVEADIEPFKGLLLGLFFVYVGMSIDLAFVWANIEVVLIGLAALVVLKLIVLLGIGALFRVPFSTSLQVSFLLAHGGEFALILLAAAAESGLLDHTVSQILVAVVVLSMALTTPLDEIGRRLAALSEGRRAERPRLETADKDGPVIVGGYGRVGQMIAQVLDAESVPWLALDADPTIVTAARKAGLPVFFGDSTRKEVLLRAGANRAPAFVVTLSNPQLAERMVRAVRDEWPGPPLFARAKDWKHADHLRRLGVDDVIPEAVEGSLQLAAHVLEGLGFEEEAIEARIEEERERAKTSHD
ncbi:Glutathione-regulated potassium-efflux system protein KefC [Alphaproteobacteria bacterium SO-S41]|nr:Glutathione-regulated potassium-efflux system protein KefC [Alphaproteobacteria bacterium SO-S41]